MSFTFYSERRAAKNLHIINILLSRERCCEEKKKNRNRKRQGGKGRCEIGQWVSVRGDFASHGNFPMSGNTFYCYSCESATGIWWGEARGDAQQLTGKPRTTQDGAASNITSAELEKP